MLHLHMFIQSVNLRDFGKLAILEHEREMPLPKALQRSNLSGSRARA